MTVIFQGLRDDCLNGERERCCTPVLFESMLTVLVILDFQDPLQDKLETSYILLSKIKLIPLIYN